MKLKLAMIVSMVLVLAVASNSSSGESGGGGGKAITVPKPVPAGGQETLGEVAEAVAEEVGDAPADVQGNVLIKNETTQSYEGEVVTGVAIDPLEQDGLPEQEPPAETAVEKETVDESGVYATQQSSEPEKETALPPEPSRGPLATLSKLASFIVPDVEETERPALAGQAGKSNTESEKEPMPQKDEKEDTGIPADGNEAERDEKKGVIARVARLFAGLFG